MHAGSPAAGTCLPEVGSAWEVNEYQKLGDVDVSSIIYIRKAATFSSLKRKQKHVHEYE